MRANFERMVFELSEPQPDRDGRFLSRVPQNPQAPRLYKKERRGVFGSYLKAAAFPLFRGGFLAKRGVNGGRGENPKFFDMGRLIRTYFWRVLLKLRGRHLALKHATDHRVVPHRKRLKDQFVASRQIAFLVQASLKSF